MANLAETLHKIEQLYHEWKSLQPVAKEDEDRLWKKFRLEWNYNSNHIEGNTLTYGETQLLLLFDKTTGDHEMREFEEMKAHDVAIKAIQEWSADKNRELTESDIRDLNRIILVRPYWKEALTYDGQATRRQIKVGEYKEHPNSVRLSNGEMFHYAKPEEVAAKMNDLMNWYRENQSLSPVILATEMHYRFILIHPFDDGNGRIARLLVNYIFMRNDLPPIIIKSADKPNYLTALNKADTGNRGAFHEYIGEQLVWSLEVAVKAGKGDDIEEEDDLDKEIALLERESKRSKVTEKKSVEIIQSIYKNSLKSLYQSIDEKLKKFDRLFIEEHKDYKVEDAVDLFESGKNAVDYISEQVLSRGNNTIRGANFFNGLSNKETLIHKIILSYIFKGYKNDGMNTFNIMFSVQTLFLDYTYEVIVGGADLKISKLYSESLTEKEIIELTNKTAKFVLEDIQNRLSK